MVHPAGAVEEAVDEADVVVVVVVVVVVDEAEDVEDEDDVVEEDEELEDDDDEEAPFLWNTVNLQLPPQICAGFPMQLDTQSVAATFEVTLMVVPQ